KDGEEFELVFKKPLSPFKLLRRGNVSLFGGRFRDWRYERTDVSPGPRSFRLERMESYHKLGSLDEVRKYFRKKGFRLAPSEWIEPFLEAYPRTDYITPIMFGGSTLSDPTGNLWFATLWWPIRAETTKRKADQSSHHVELDLEGRPVESWKAWFCWHTCEFG